jgi:hypothetical protein
MKKITLIIAVLFVTNTVMAQNGGHSASNGGKPTPQSSKGEKKPARTSMNSGSGGGKSAGTHAEGREGAKNK